MQKIEPISSFKNRDNEILHIKADNSVIRSKLSIFGQNRSKLVQLQFQIDEISNQIVIIIRGKAEQNQRYNLNCYDKRLRKQNVNFKLYKRLQKK